MTTAYNTHDKRSIMTKVANAFISLRDGSNRIADFNLLVSAMNIGMIRAETIGDQAVKVFREAQQALVAADEVYGSLRCYIFTPDALIAIAKGVQAYSELLNETTPEQMEKAGNEVERRLATGIIARSGNTH